MQGVLDCEELEGITPRMIKKIFRHINNNPDQNIQYIIKISIVEIYNEKIRDLIDVDKTNLNIRECKKKGIYIEDLTECTVEDEKDVLNIIKKGMDNRAIAATNMNEGSSRSHSMVILNVIQNNIVDLSVKCGKLYLVDLAGSEKISKTGATGSVLDEAKAINKSLTNLGIVINALTEAKGNNHVPYRDSKLTRVLQESLGGNAKTCLIVTCSPSVYNEAETLSTLRFGYRAKKVKNNAKINKEYSVQELKGEVNKLEGQIGKFKSRIELLEEFLIKNGLSLPNEKDDNIEMDLSISEADAEIEIYNLKNNIDENNKQNAINDKNILEMNHKYIEIIDIINVLESEKLELQEQLETAVNRINEFKIENEQKEVMLNELEQIKLKSEQKSKEMEKEIEKMNLFTKKNKHNLSLVAELNTGLEIIPEKAEEIYLAPFIDEVDESSLCINNIKEKTEEINLFSTKQYTNRQSESEEVNTRSINISPFNIDEKIDRKTLEALFDKLKEVSNKYPEINEVIESYREKIYTNNSNSNSSKELKNESQEENLIRDLDVKVDKVYIYHNYLAIR